MGVPLPSPGPGPGLAPMFGPPLSRHFRLLPGAACFELVEVYMSER